VSHGTGTNEIPLPLGSNSRMGREGKANSLILLFREVYLSIVCQPGNAVASLLLKTIPTRVIHVYLRIVQMYVICLIQNSSTYLYFIDFFYQS